MDLHARGTRDASASRLKREGKKVLRGVEPRLKECTIRIESETFVLTVILQDRFDVSDEGLAYSKFYVARPAQDPRQVPRMAVDGDIQQTAPTVTSHKDNIRTAATLHYTLRLRTSGRARDRSPTALSATPGPCALLPLTCALPHAYYSACPSTFHVEIIVQHESAFGLDNMDIWHGCTCA